jgi:lantibiotic biosynthesis protein
MEDLEQKLSEIVKVFDNEKRYNGHPSLFGGDLSIILFYLHVYEYNNDSQLFEKAIEKLEEFLDNIVIESIHPSYCTGLAGLGFLIEYIEQKGWVEMDTNDVLGDIDEYLYLKMIEMLKMGNHDFLHGAVGIGFYFIYRSRKTVIAKKYLEDFVIELENQAHVEKNGNMKWEYFDFVRNIPMPDEYNLGLSHGIPATLSFLIKVHREGILLDKTLVMIKASTQFILSKKLDYSANYSTFPDTFNESYQPVSTRLAWCYGDLGICCVLWQVSKLTNDAILQQDLIQIMLQDASRRSVELTNIVDAGICHGAAGAAHIFQRFYDWTNEEEFRKAADYWYKVILEMAIYEDGYAGYKSHSPIEYGGNTPNASFLEGISGIGLVLLYKISEIDPAWEELLFIR